MKKSDLKRLEKVAKLYQQIEELLDTTCDSIDNGDTEFIQTFGSEPTTTNTWSLVRDMYKDARLNRQWIVSKTNLMKEQLTIK